MAAEKPVEQKPSVGRIVIYRSREGVDMAAIVTEVMNDDGDVHLHPFPPPSAGPPVLSYEHGTPQATDTWLDGCWRWPERV